MFHLSADVRVVHQTGLDLGEAYRTEEHLWILSLTFGDLQVLEVGLGIGVRVGFTFDWWVHKCRVDLCCPRVVHVCKVRAGEQRFDRGRGAS